jgi:hypothetical protein
VKKLSQFSQIRKLIVTLVGFLVLWIKDTTGVELSQEWIDNTVTLIIAALTIFGVYRVPNEGKK